MSVSEVAAAIRAVIDAARPRTYAGDPFRAVDPLDRRPVEDIAPEMMRAYTLTVGPPQDAGYSVGPAAGPAVFRLAVEIHYPARRSDMDMQAIGQDHEDLRVAIGAPSVWAGLADLVAIDPDGTFRQVLRAGGELLSQVLTLTGVVELTA